MISCTLKFLPFFVAVCVVLPSPCFAQNKSGDPLVKRMQKAADHRTAREQKEAEEMEKKRLKKEVVDNQKNDEMTLGRMRTDLKEIELNGEENSEEHVISGRSTRRLIKGVVGIFVVVGGFGIKLLLGTLGESSSGSSDQSDDFNDIKIKTRCNHCKKGYRVSVKKVGQVIRCKQCGKEFLIQDSTV